MKKMLTKAVALSLVLGALVLLQIMHKLSVRLKRSSCSPRLMLII